MPPDPNSPLSPLSVPIPFPRSFPSSKRVSSDVKTNEQFDDFSPQKYSSHILIPVYLKARNEISYRKLGWLEKYSGMLPIPKLFGEAVSLDTIDLFIGATLETRHRALFFLKKIIPKLSRKQSFLDIGPGKGKLTVWIGRKFQKVTIIDTCSSALESIKEQSFRKGVSVTKIQKEFLNNEFAQQKFDLINMSHMIYYLSKNQLIQNIKKAYDLLALHGILVVVFNEGLHREQIARDFGGNPQSFDIFLKLFSSMYSIDVKIYTSKESFYTKGPLSMLHICGVHLCDQDIKVERKALEAYINEHYLDNEGRYCMNMYQKFAVISKV